MRSRWFLLAGWLAVCAGCAWPPRPYEGGPGASPGTVPPGGASSGAVATLLLPNDGTPNADGSVTSTVVAPDGTAIGHVDFFTSAGAPVTDASGRTFVPDAVIGVGGLENPSDPGSPEVPGELDIPADQMQPGATFTTQAGALQFVVTIEQADVEAVDGAAGLDVSSLVVQVDIFEA